MPCSPERVESLVQDRFAATLALGHSQVDVAGLAERFALVDVVADLLQVIVFISNGYLSILCPQRFLIHEKE